jgi:hypothetical protein
VTALKKKLRTSGTSARGSNEAAMRLHFLEQHVPRLYSVESWGYMRVSEGVQLINLFIDKYSYERKPKEYTRKEMI